MLFWLRFFVLCFIQHCYPFLFLKTSVNAQPLSPPIFEKFAPHFKIFFYIIWVLYVRIVLLFHIFVDFQMPLPAPPWVRLVPFVIYLGAMFNRFGWKLSNDEGGNDKQETCRELSENVQETNKKCKEPSEKYKENCQTKSVNHERCIAFFHTTAAATNLQL